MQRYKIVPIEEYQVIVFDEYGTVLNKKDDIPVDNDNCFCKQHIINIKGPGRGMSWFTPNNTSNRHQKNDQLIFKQ